ncbi:MAG: triose-phosphate isomerase [Burkholderiales bacterium]
MRQRLVAGNWKMFGNSARNQLLLEAVAAQAGALQQAGCAVCVPFPYLSQARSILADSGVSWGAQNASQWPEGAYTGEVSVAMIADFGCRYVIVGHSERRSLFHENDEMVAAKAEAVLGHGMVPIVCVGESLDERERGVTESVVSRQLRAVIDKVGIEGLGKSVVAYEPVWAIGTGKTATPDQAQAVHADLRALIAEHDSGVAESMTMLYGGSVKAANASSLFAMEDIDGGLIGGASLKAEEFMAICEAADR